MMGYANNLFQLTKVVLLSFLKLNVLAWEKKKEKRIVWLQIVKLDD